MTYYTEEGLDQLKKELSFLKGEARIRVAHDIAEACKKGDLSENAEYDAAREAQGLLEAKIAALENLVASARVLNLGEIDLSRVSILSKACVKNRKTGMESVFMLVSQGEADLKQSKISVDSPIGKGILGKKVGDIAMIDAPAGIIELEILKIGLDL
ncbi:MAG: transcription elongation factor GreA [Candidatus Cardinium sp.]|uniref:Transcription elongation factor GreA n=1 Tax=Candidatus Cardinium hertigii TaxID=247481 RepID=A0A2Z3L7P5_9BACT|nr:transcription elongation factor GreA [Candidatus Cardinium hertigii]AWN81663.1 Transcription elongation factor GreA [Candidatus Cardinium hertigii]MDD9139680.1 transcription elongation factor GreA [Candidatus Cardinium sp.]